MQVRIIINAFYGWAGKYCNLVSFAHCHLKLSTPIPLLNVDVGHLVFMNKRQYHGALIARSASSK